MKNHYGCNSQSFYFQKKIEKMMKNKNNEIHDETMYNDGKIRPIFAF